MWHKHHACHHLPRYMQKQQYLISDPDELRRIKFAQFRVQVPALIVLALAIILNRIFPRAGNWIYGISLALAIGALVAYFFIGLCFRFRQRIPLPSEDALLSPIEGRISRIIHDGDHTLLTIRKGIFDSVELRSPHSDCSLEDGMLWLETPAGKIQFRFNFQRIQWFVEPDMKAGNLIGMVVGNGSCTVVLPGKPDLTLQQQDAVKAAENLAEPEVLSLYGLTDQTE